jgi:hypothetical protein
MHGRPRYVEAAKKESIMASIVIKDLPESIELDRQAMVAIVGGSRFRGRAALPNQGAFRSTKVFTLQPVRTIRSTLFK